ncbi:hypothetical protein TNCV_979451 [Trichonephila clavipes]|nr:hypothetical protein TNCV_979451 [Trichonephila clavipes]
MRVLKQCTDEYQTTRNAGSGRWKVMSALHNRHLLHMAVNDRTASSRQLLARWSIATRQFRLFVYVCCTVDCVRRCLYTGVQFRTTEYSQYGRRIKATQLLM